MDSKINHLMCGCPKIPCFIQKILLTCLKVQTSYLGNSKTLINQKR